MLEARCKKELCDPVPFNMTTKLERQDSVISILSSGIDHCRICHCDSSCGELISPCYCSGSLRWVHQACLQHWIKASNKKACELCRYPYCMRSKMKNPLNWESLPMSASEKRRLCCSAIFHFIALGCVIWSLYVLIDRTIDEAHLAELEWQFWTKIVVEAIGCVGAGILIYVWGKSYFQIINQWIAFNRTFVIVNSSPQLEKKPLPADTSCSKQSVGRASTPTPAAEPLSGSACHGGPLNGDNSLPVSSPVVTVLSPGLEEASEACGGIVDAHDISPDKSKEAKTPLLPPVSYSSSQNQ